MRYLQVAVFSSVLLCLSMPLAASELMLQRMDFLHAERLLASKQFTESLVAIENLSSYPLYPYLKAKWLKENLHETEQIKTFLTRYSETRYASKVRAAWLPYLAKEQRWAELITDYQATDTVDNQCLFHQARYLTGEQTAALQATKALWLLGEDLPSQCDFLLNAFKASPEFSTELLWERFDLALQKRQAGLAEHLRNSLSPKEQVIADFWLQLQDNPEHIQSVQFKQFPVAQQAAMFAYGIQRLARNDPEFAAQLWDARAELPISTAREQQVARTVALALASNKVPGAFQRLMRLTEADEEVKEWRVRAALLEHDWSHVISAITALPTEEQTEAQWQYWLARAKAQLHDADTATALFKQLANKTNYYGFLAADQIDTEYTFTDQPLQVSSTAKAALLAREDVKIAQELRFHRRNYEAEKQWWHIIKHLDKADLKVAAKVAQEWQWQHMAIFTLAKADSWEDMELRFPVAYQDTIVDHAATQTLDPAWIFGVIRQESAFDAEAASPVGARGLMQIMPATGAQIARELHEPPLVNSALFEPQLNIKYGSYYLSQLSRRFKGHAALATAAYNAGPHRVKTWLPEHHKIAADIWIETIPFKETRRYVAAVLSYALIYQQRLQRSGLKMRDLMHEVFPL